MSKFANMFMEDGKLRKFIMTGGQKYELIYEDIWVACYSSQPNKKLIASKILIGLFDSEKLNEITPSTLSPEEHAHAALAIQTAGKKAAIPESWKSFARKFYESL